jgi:LDH2 family malate/lactate/ureidoglycolate dehydrogenase
MKLVQIEALRHCLAGAFERLDLAPEDADGLAGLLVDSELRGHPDHGVEAVLSELYRDGKLNPVHRRACCGRPTERCCSTAIAGRGPAVPTRAIRWCIERARLPKLRSY